MRSKHNPGLVPFARQLRREMTREERHLWYDFLRTYPIRFNRQKVLGKYIADFYCAEAALAVELDGSEHYEGEGPERDAVRTACLQAYGLEVLRFSNAEINQSFRGVCGKIDLVVRQRIEERRAQGRE